MLYGIEIQRYKGVYSVTGLSSISGYSTFKNKLKMQNEIFKNFNFKACSWDN